MILKVPIGKVGRMEIMDYNIKITDQSNVRYITSLRNRVWKLLPIYEGRDKDKKIVMSADKAYDNFYKNLEKLILEVSGASEIWFENSYYIELLYLLTGMKTFLAEDHARIKSIVTHCTDLCEKIKKELLEKIKKEME